MPGSEDMEQARLSNRGHMLETEEEEVVNEVGKGSGANSTCQEATSWSPARGTCVPPEPWARLPGHLLSAWWAMIDGAGLCLLKGLWLDATPLVPFPCTCLPGLGPSKSIQRTLYLLQVQVWARTEWQPVTRCPVLQVLTQQGDNSPTRTPARRGSLRLGNS